MGFQDNVIRFSELLGTKFFEDIPFPFYQRPHVLEYTFLPNDSLERIACATRRREREEKSRLAW